MADLDEHQKRILRFIERYENQNGRTPSYEEIRQGTGMSSKDHVYRDVQSLEKSKYVRREPAISRGITLLRTVEGYPVTPFAYSIPVIDRTANRDTKARPDGVISDWIEITRVMIPDAEDVYAFRVEGDSMIDSLVHDGDLVVVKRQDSARNGELVAVRVRNAKQPEISLKRYFRYDGEVWLQPENPEIPAVSHRSTEVQIEGQVLCIIRHVTSERAVGSPRRRAA